MLVRFTFIDGRLGYDCHACGSQCCRGHGYGFSRHVESQLQIKSRPHLQWFLEPRNGTHGVTMSNCIPTCGFLDGEGLCQIQNNHGAAAKPSTCRLFPFNNIRTIENYVIVSPHTGLCPLTSMTSGPSGLSSHEALRGLIDEGLGISELRPVVGHIRNLDRLLDLESQLLIDSDGWSASPSPSLASMASRQFEVSADHGFFGLGTTGSSPAYLQMLGEIWGELPPLEVVNSPSLCRSMAVAIPIIRNEVLFPCAGPFALAQLPVAFVHRITTALHIMCAAAVSAGVYDMSLKTVLRIFRGQIAVLTLLALLECRLVWAHSSLPDLSGFEDTEERMRFIRIVQRLLRPNGSVLADALFANQPKLGLERTLFAKRVAARLFGKVAPVTNAGKSSGQRWSLRRARHWAYSAMPAEVISSALGPGGSTRSIVRKS